MSHRRRKISNRDPLAVQLKEILRHENINPVVHVGDCDGGSPVIESHDSMPAMSNTPNELKTLGCIPAGFHPMNQAYNGILAAFDVLFFRAP
jgi:hypothetical protein